MLDGLSSMRSITSYITHFFLNMFMDPPLFGRGCHISLNHFFSTWQARFLQQREKTLLAVEDSAISITSETTSIEHPDARQGLFVARPIRKGSVVGYYSGLVS